MTSPAYEQLLVVQDLDLADLQLKHKYRNHPMRAAMELAETEQSDAQTLADEVIDRRSVLEAGQAELDGEVSIIEVRRVEIETKLYDGSVTGTKDLLALQDEAKMLKQRQSSIEDDELLVMEQIEEIEAELEPFNNRIRDLEVQRAELGVDLDSALAEIDVEVARISEQRVAEASALPADLLTQYEGLREDLGGVAVARLVGSTCDGCHMTMSAVEFDRIKRQGDDAVINCDQCGRLLVR